MIRYVLLALVMLLTGCASTKPADPSSWAPPPLAEPAPPETVDGSLFNAAYSSSLFEDRMAYRVGDILTIYLDEKTKSVKSSGTSIDKKSGLELPAPMIWGQKKPIETSFSLDRLFSGKGASSQQNMLDGSITVSVVQVLPNGALKIRGEKWITLNQGDEYIRLSGILRPEDITQDNTVSSQRLANARIVYSGKGPLTESNNPGWLTRFFNSPIMPF